MVQENASRPLAALEDAVDEQRSVIADIARLGLPHDGASQREARMRAQSARLANPNAKAVLKRFSDDKEVSRHAISDFTCTDECCSLTDPAGWDSSFVFSPGGPEFRYSFRIVSSTQRRRFQSRWGELLCGDV